MTRKQVKGLQANRHLRYQIGNFSQWMDC